MPSSINGSPTAIGGSVHKGVLVKFKSEKEQGRQRKAARDRRQMDAMDGWRDEYKRKKANRGRRPPAWLAKKRERKDDRVPTGEEGIVRDYRKFTAGGDGHFVYVMRHDLYRKGVYKIGYTGRDPEERAKETGSFLYEPCEILGLVGFGSEKAAKDFEEALLYQMREKGWRIGESELVDVPDLTVVKQAIRDLGKFYFFWSR